MEPKLGKGDKAQRKLKRLLSIKKKKYNLIVITIKEATTTTDDNFHQYFYRFGIL